MHYVLDEGAEDGRHRLIKMVASEMLAMRGKGGPGICLDLFGWMGVRPELDRITMTEMEASYWRVKYVLDFHDLEDREKSVWLLDLASEYWRLGKALRKLWSRRFTAKTP